MPRRGNVEKRVIPPDPRYDSVLVQKFINKVMQRGKKSVAETIVYKALDLAAERTKKPPLEVFEQALRNASPSIEVKPKRVGGEERSPLRPGDALVAHLGAEPHRTPDVRAPRR